MKFRTRWAANAAATLFLSALGTGPALAVVSNAAPTITSTPKAVADVDRHYRQALTASDADQDALSYRLLEGPVGMTLESSALRLHWQPQASSKGVHRVRWQVEDGKGGRAEQQYDLRVVDRFCAIYPIALPESVVAGLSAGQSVNQMPRGTGTGNYSWLSWSGSNSAPTAAASLLPPGDSYTYRNPDNSSDQVLNIGDFAQGAPGSMNASAIRNSLDALLNTDIILPTWDSKRGQGSNLDYRVARFVTVRLRDYRLTGNGWISFEYRGVATCYNHAPVAQPQSLETAEDTALAVVLNGNDSDGDEVTYELVSQPQHGRLTGEAPNLIYAPNSDFHGDDSFRFRVGDGSLQSEPATIDIRVTPVNDAPRADSQSLSTNEDTPLPITLTGTDIDGDALGFRIVDVPQYGSLTGTAPNLIYTPSQNFHGEDSIRFVVNDGNIDSVAAEIRITVRPINDAPTADAQQLATDEDTPLALVLTGADVDGDALSFEVLSAPQHGVLSGTAPNLVYTPAADFHGTDSFTFKVSDSLLESAPAEITLIVRPVNDAPLANAQSVATDEDTALPIVLTGSDLDSDPLSFTITAPPTNGSLSGTAPDLIYTPNPDFHGSDSFRFRSSDGSLSSDEAAVDIEVRPINDAPSANPQSLEIERGQTLTITLSGSDVDGDALSFRITKSPNHGQLTGADADWSYTPHSDFSGDDVFEFVAHDGRLDSEPALVAIHVTQNNTAPTFVSDPVLRALESASYQYDADATDPEDDPLTYVLEQSPSLSIDASTGLISGEVDSAYTQPVRTFNRQCYVIPDDYEQVDANGTVRSPLYQRVRQAISKASDYVAPQTVTWHQTNGCLGCHVQNQALAGLQGARSRAQVDGQTADYLRAEILSSQQPDGSIRRSHPEFSKTQTAFALWALAFGEDRASTLDARVKGLSFLFDRRSNQDEFTYWVQDHSAGWLRDGTAMTAVVLIVVDMTLKEIAALSDPPPEYLELRDNYLQVMPRVAEAFLYSGDWTHVDTNFVAFRVLAGESMLPWLTDSAQINRIENMVLFSHEDLKSRQGTDGGWALQRGGVTSDPLVSAWVGFALNSLNSTARDEIVLRNVEFLLSAQAENGTWATPSGYFATHLGTTGLVMAYLPVALDHLGNPDLSLGNIRRSEVSEAVEVEVMNRGLASVSSGSTVTLHAGRSAAGVVLGTAEVTALASGESRWVSIPVADTISLVDVYATVASNQPIEECDTRNNFSLATLVKLRTNDPQGLFDTQRYFLNLEDANSAPRIVSQPITVLQQGLRYDYRVTVADDDIGDAHEFSLIDAPAGLYINPLTGRFSYDLASLPVGDVNVRVRVIDLRGLSAEQSFQLTVVANHAPEITSTPPLQAYVGQAYRYQVTATDPDNDELSYRLDGAPLTMEIDSATGLITWAPLSVHLGDEPVNVVVEDGRGGSDSQSYVIRVEEAPVNRPPVITSAPSASVDEGQQYIYDVDALDPDVGDELDYQLLKSPSPSAIDRASGRISWSPSSEYFGALRLRNRQCRSPSDFGKIDPVVKWHWNSSTVLPAYNQVMSAPVVVPLRDTNGDGRIDELDQPDVAFVSYGGGGSDSGDGVVRVVSGSDGHELFAVSDPTARVPSYSNLAAADLDGDGIVEIVAPLMQGGLVAIASDGSIKWSNPLPAFSWNIGAPTIVDLDQDGSPEIVMGKRVYSSNGQLLWQGGAPYDGNSHLNPIASIGIAADLADTPGLEVLVGPSLYTAGGDLLWRYDALGDGVTAVGDLDGDQSPEVVLVASGNLVALNATGEVKWGPVALGDGGRGGPPTIADFDNDGAADIGVASRSFYQVFDGAGRLKWRQSIVDYSSNITGSTLFDFDGDGAVEALQADERTFKILDGATGQVRFELPNSNGTAYEFPVVADVDRDGSADILLASNQYYPGSEQTGLRMLSSETRSWMPTRSIWNQHAYHIDNINDDGTVPRQPQKSWLTHNTFRLNTFPDRHPLGMADLALFDLRLDESDSTAVKVLVVNRGLAPTSAVTSVRIFNGDPNAGGQVLGSVNVPVLAAGEELTLTLGGLNPLSIDTDLHARIDEAQAIEECLDDNNHTAAAYFEVRATDQGGLFDTQRFTVTVENVNEAPTIITSALPSASVNQPYRFTVLANDPDLGDGLRFELIDPPTGLSIEQVSGELRWNPVEGQTGAHSITIRVTDLGGLSAERTFGLQVSAEPNQAPSFSSQPITSAQVAVAYQYRATATDPDGDAINFTLLQGPPGMLVNASTGVVDWTPPSGSPASVSVELRVDDGKGGDAVQAYTITVSAAGSNRPPVITSTPGTSVVAGQQYRYLIDANDPDGDALTVRLTQKPVGMTLNEFSGEVRWTPGSADVGSHAVTLEVDDFKGGVARQSFNLAVSAPQGNQAPVITSSPSFNAKAGREYRYDVIATDANGDTLSYSLPQAPAGMTINATTGAIRWLPVTAGPASATVRVSDGQGWTEQSWSFTVAPSEQALAVSVQVAPDPVPRGGEFTLSVSIVGAAGPTTSTASINGAPITLDEDGSTTLTAPNEDGRHRIVVTVSDDYDTVSVEKVFNVGVPSDIIDPVAIINAPREGAQDELLVVTSPQDVRITVSDDELASWTLGLVERGAPAGSYIEIASGNGAMDNALAGKLDPTLLQNGLYNLVLQAEDQSGNFTQDNVLISVEGAMKLGHFAISFIDLQVPVAGLPVTITRSYDTRQRHKPLDFGYGWTIDYQSLRLQESRRPGYAWQLMTYPSGPLGLLPKYCIEAALGNVVSVTMPDGEVEKFRAVAYPACFDTAKGEALSLDVELRFEPMPGTEGKLKVTHDNFGRLINQHLADPGDPNRPLDPNGYVYTNASGQDFTLDQGFTVREIHEHEGDNRVTFNINGIIHSAGPSVTLVRDAQNRIKKVIAPDLSEIDYEYDADGNLVAMIDANDNRTQFTYLGGHYLEDIIDPRGVRVSRNEYNDEGRLIAVVDADGNRIEYTHDIDGRVEQVKDRNGNTTTYVFNERGDVLVETNAEGESITRTYDADGNTLSEINDAGQNKAWTYDALGNVLSETDGENGVTRNTYGAFNQLNTVKDANGVVVLNNFYRNQSAGGVPIYPGPLVSITDGNNLSTTFGYDSNTGELAAITDATGATSRFETDSRGYKTADIDALGHRTEYLNDDLGRVLEERRRRTDAQGMVETLVTHYAYDNKGNVTQVTHPDGSITSTEYDGNDKPIRECDALQRCTVTHYDDRGNVERIDYPDGRFETKAYDANGNLIAETDRLGVTTQYVYDKANRLVETILPDASAGTAGGDGNDANNPRTRNVYDDAGQLVESIDANGQSTRYEYDRAGRRIKTLLPPINGVRAELRTEYDPAGRRLSEIDADGNATRFEYDDGGRLIRSTAPSIASEPEAVASTEYDGAGRKISETDAVGRTTRYAYDKLGRLVRVVLPDPASGNNPALVNGESPLSSTLTSRYVYDEVGNKIEQIDAEGRGTRWEYDNMGRETARILPGGQREAKTYTLAGELKESTDFNGDTTRYVYDDLGRLSQIDYPQDADVFFSYNARGERTLVRDGRGDSTAGYDRQGRVLQVHDADGHIIEYQYDAAGNLLARISPSQSLVYTYDARNRLTEVTRTVDGEAPSTTRYEYDANGSRQAMVGGDGTRTEYGYDARHRLRNLVKRTAAGVLMLAMNYQVDASGMRTGIEESDANGLVRSVAYQYDGVKRLTEEVIDHRDDAHDRSSRWTYDKVGNRLTQVVDTSTGSETTSYVYDSNDRLTSEQVDGVNTVYSYDDNGNTTGKASPGVLIRYTYDDANRLIEADSGDAVTRYVYNADGLRVRSTHTPTGATPITIYYLQDSGYAYAQVIEEYRQEGQGAKTLSATYTFADELVSQTRYDASGNPSTSFVQMDGFGSTRWITDAAGSITDSIDYDAFGVEVRREGTTDVQHLYRGEAFDPNVGFYYLRARWMDPGVGRFVTQDTYMGNGADPASLHKYIYTHSNPVNAVDPSGHFQMNELMMGLQLQQARMTISSVSAGVRLSMLKEKVFLVAAILVGIAIDEIMQRPGERDIPTIWFGHADVGEAAAHYEQALKGNKKSVLQYVSPGARPQWYRYKKECKASAADQQCDEYPFGKTREGGPSNYPDGVSLKPIKATDNMLAGTRFSQFLGSSGCRISPNLGPKSTFKVGTTSGMTTWNCGKKKR